MIAAPPERKIESNANSEFAANSEAPRTVAGETPSAVADEYVYLAGRPTPRRFIQFVKDNSASPQHKASLLAEWEAAHEHIRTLEKEEAGLADNPSLTKVEMTSDYEPLLAEFLKDPLIRHGFNTVPTEVAFVELSRLVVYQKHIDLTFVRQLKARLGQSPTEEQIFRTCLPYDHPHPPVNWSRTESDAFVFMSPSNDLRFLGAMPLRSKNICRYPPPGSLVGVVGIAVGFGSNFLNAVYAENRLILNNGSHRAYALRDMGFNRVPCIVQHVSSRAQLEVVASARIRENPDNYLKHPRPSMLKDYFDPKLRKVFPVHRRLRQVTVKFQVKETYVPTL